MSQDIDRNDDDHQRVKFSDGFIVNPEPISSENQARYVNFSEFQSEDDPKMSSWKVKNGPVKCTVNAVEDEVMEHLINEVNQVKASMLRIFMVENPDLVQVLQIFLGLSLLLTIAQEKSE